MDEESKEITLEEVAANVLIDLNGLRPGDPGYDSAVKAADMVLRHVDESNRRDLEERQAEKEAEHQEQLLKFEKQKHEAEMAQLTRQNDIKEFEVKVARFAAGVTLTIGIGSLGRDVWEFCKANKFEVDGAYRSLISKIATSRINKR